MYVPLDTVERLVFYVHGGIYGKLSIFARRHPRLISIMASVAVSTEIYSSTGIPSLTLEADKCMIRREFFFGMAPRGLTLKFGECCCTFCR